MELRVKSFGLGVRRENRRGTCQVKPEGRWRGPRRTSVLHRPPDGGLKGLERRAGGDPHSGGVVLPEQGTCRRL